jgi:hypothetical protein
MWMGMFWTPGPGMFRTLITITTRASAYADESAQLPNVSYKLQQNYFTTTLSYGVWATPGGLKFARARGSLY